MRQKRLKNSLLTVSAMALCIAVVAIAMTMFTESHSQAPTSYIHSVGIPVGETKYLEVEGNTLVGMTVNYTVIEREGGYGVVHNWNVGCPNGTAGFGDVCYPTISLIDFCGLYSPELKVTAKENELFDISCELDVLARAEQNIKDGIAAQAIIDSALTELKATLIPLPEKTCQLNYSGFSNTSIEGLPESLCVPDRKVAQNWQCHENDGFELTADFIAVGDTVDLHTYCAKELVSGEVLCPAGFEFDADQGFCTRPIENEDRI